MSSQHDVILPAVERETTLNSFLTFLLEAKTVLKQRMTSVQDPQVEQIRAPLEEHYTEQTIQAHVMAAYAEKGLESVDTALRLSEDYFVLERDAFMRRWMPGRGTEFRRQATGKAWSRIVEALGLVS